MLGSPDCFGTTGSEMRRRRGLWPRTGRCPEWALEASCCLPQAASLRATHSLRASGRCPSACSLPPLRVARLWSPGPSHAGRPRSRGGHTLGPGSHAGGAVSGVKAASRCTSHGLSGQQAPTRQVFTTRPCPRPSAKFLSSSSGCRLALQGSAPLWGPHLGSRLEGPLAPRGATHFPLPPLQGCPVSPLSARAAG